jgi:hypothetical protein
MRVDLQLAALTDCRERSGKGAVWMGSRVYIGRSRNVRLADLCLLVLRSTVVLEPYPLGNPQQHPSSTGYARELASCASDTGHRHRSSWKTSPNNRIPDAGVCADGQGSDGRLHSIGSKSSRPLCSPTLLDNRRAEFTRLNH